MSLRENGKKLAVYAAQTLVQLLDTNIINKANGDILQYDSTTQKWKNQPTTFTEASSRANIDSGDSISTIFGKIKKFFSDLKAVAFSGSYSDLINKPTNVSTFTNDSGYLNNSTLPSSIQDLTIVSFSGAGSSDAYCLLCEIKINQTYINGPTEIILSERGRSITTRICISWQSVNNVDPGLAAFNVILGAHNDIWMVKTAASTWNLYIRKNENWSSIFVKNVYTYGGCTITWKMQNASLPSGGTQAAFYLHSLYNYCGVSAGTNVTVQVVSSGSQYAYTVNAVDEKVGQTNTGATNADYRILYSGTADDTNRIEGARKGRLYWNPNSVRLFFMNGHGLWNNVAKTLTFQNGSDSNHAICHGAYGGDDNRWGLWPNKDGWESLGDSARRWGQIYSTNGSISTSDRNEKKDIESLDEKARDFILNLNPVSYKFIDGNTGRTHYGLIAQDVEKTLEKMNLSPMDFAGFCKDQKMDEKYKTVQETRIDEETGEEYEENVTVQDFKAIEGEYRYGLRYEEFIGPIIKTEQLQQEDINSLKEEISLLKEEIEMLKKKLDVLESKQ